MFAVLFSTATSAFYHKHQEQSFLSWMRETNQFFTGEEYHFRLGVYLTNARLIQNHDSETLGYRVALNHLAHLTSAEYKSLLGHRNRQDPNAVATVSNVKAADSWDWRDKNIVNPPKDQAQCGSCWAFSIIQAQESQWALKKGTLPSLSEQNIVDCVTTCYGCNGGDEYLAYDYVIKYQGGAFMTESDYPYTAKDGKCKFDKTKGCCPIKSYVRPTTTQNEEELKNGCYDKGVVSIAIDASGWDFQSYAGGIYNPSRCSSTSLDHAVGLVGYGTEGSTDYWIVRNSWGKTWGEKGYIRMIRNHKNKCGVATDVIIPLVE